MADGKSFQDKQKAFAARIRDPEHEPVPEGIEPRRMAVYNDLFFNNLFNLLGTFFPVLRKIHSDAHWRRFIRGFLRRHRATTPYFLQLPEEFLAYLRDEFEATNEDYPFLQELAHYEYAELALSVSELEIDVDDVDPDGDLLAGVPVKSPLAWAYAYSFPVHRISPEFLPAAPGDQATFLVLYRDGEDGIRFFELNAISAALLEDIDDNQAGRTGEALLRALADRLAYPDPDALVGHGGTALMEMRRRGILVGSRNPS